MTVGKEDCAFAVVSHLLTMRCDSNIMLSEVRRGGRRLQRLPQPRGRQESAEGTPDRVPNTEQGYIGRLEKNQSTLRYTLLRTDYKVMDI